MIKHYSNGKITSLETSIDGKELVWSHIKPDVNVLSGPNGSGKGELLRSMVKQSDSRYAVAADIYKDSEDSKHRFTLAASYFNKKNGGPKQDVINLLNSRLSEYCNGYRFDPDYYLTEGTNEYGEFWYIPDSQGVRRLITMYLWVFDMQYTEYNPDLGPVFREAYIENPDVYLHFDLIKKLIGDFKSIAPDVQFFITTYNPALIIEGWHDRVSEITDLYIKPL